MKYLFTILISVFFASLTTGQTFSNDREKFVKEFSKLMRSSTSNDMKPFIEEELSPLLLMGNAFSKEYFERMVNTANLMIEKRHKAYPEVYNYVYSVTSLVKTDQPKASYDAWHKSLDQLLDNRNPRRFEDFIEVSGAFFSRNVVALDRNFEWICRGGSYEFIYDKSVFIKFENTTLMCKTINRGSSREEQPYSDSIKIKNTSGTLDLSRKRWEGQGGIFNWEKVGLPKEETYAKIGKYRTSFRSTNFSCDSVILTTPYIDEPVPGKLNDRAKKGAINRSLDLPYPQFNSFEASFKINDIVEGVNYEGGFALEAEEFVGIGNENKPAQLIFERNEKPFVRTTSSQVRVSEKQLRIPSAQVAIFIGLEDSITHSGLSAIFKRDQDELQLTRGNSGISQSPFVNSYHQLDMYVEQIKWNRSSSKLDLGYNFSTSEQQRSARFESFGFFDEKLYQQLQGMASVHPLTALHNYAYKYDRFTMDEGKAASALKLTISQAKPRLLDLSTLGFISYDTENGIVRIKQKTEHFVKAKTGKSDFDNISFTADLSPIRTEGSSRGNSNDKRAREQRQRIEERNRKRSQMKSFGTLDLSSLALDVQAVDRVPISEFKQTAIFPENDELTVNKNRSFEFTGWINSGRWEVRIKEGNYSYEKHGFNIFESDVALFRAVPQKKAHGNSPILIQSAIEGLKGELIVDTITNRSGLDQNYGNYPQLISKEKTRVYYDQKEIHRGAYEKDRFYFEIDPFEIDSLVSFNDDFLRFSGELTSAGIFPTISEELKLMPDYSLGFSQKAPDDGYEFYGTEAKYENKILLSNQGLQGGGVINFINSTSKSKRLFTFLPDSTIGVAEFSNKPQEQGTEYPDAEGPDVFITFLPRKKVLKAKSNKELISFYDDEAKLRGSTTIRESGMRGNGLLEFTDATLGSKNFKFGRWDLDADTSSFQLDNKYKEEGDLTEDPLAFKTDNVQADVSFKDRKGVFKSNEGESTVEFPVNQYICKIDQFTWQMDSDEMTLEKKKSDNLAIEGNMDLVGPNFFSIHPDQDSLQFRSPKAKFSLKERTIYCYETEYIEVADARIFPDSMTVVIRKKAQMDPLDNAKIVANFITKYHEMHNVHAEITARRAYTAEGDYSYSKINGQSYDIHMDEITLDTSYQTKANGSVVPEDSFRMSEEFAFYGTVNLRAANPLLRFDGATRIKHNCEKFKRNWMAFSSDIDPENIQIPVDENMKDLDGNRISAGILWRNSNVTDSVRLYPTFLSSTRADEDPVVISASGFLQYDEGAKEYQIASKDKLVNRSAKGNYVSLHTESCSLNGDGHISLGMDYGQLKTDAVGVANYNQESGKTSMNVTLSIQAPLETSAFEDVGEKIAELEELNPVDFSSTTLEQAFMEWVDQETADEIKSDYTLKREFKSVPRPLRDKIIITGLRLTSYEKFGDQQRGLKTSVDQAGIVSFFSEPVMKYVPLKMFAQQRTAIGDRLGLLIDVPGAYLYFLDYDYRKDGTMNILSSDKEFNEEITDLKSDKKKTKNFMYQMTKNSAYKSQFLRIFKE